LTEAGFFY